MIRTGELLFEQSAQGSLEYALTVLAVLSLIVGMAALWRMGERGGFAELAHDAASHRFEGDGYADIALY